MIETFLPTYDPNRDVRFASANAALTSRQQEAASFSRLRTEQEIEEDDRHLEALHAAYHAQFRTVEAYRDHFMELELRMNRGHDVPHPHFREGASLEEVRALLVRFREDIQLEKAWKRRPVPVDPPGLVPFTAAQRPGSQRFVEDYTLPASWDHRAIPCRLAMEATAHDLHICFISLSNDVSITNNVERLATRIYRERFAPNRAVDRLRSIVGLQRAGIYPPRSITFYEYWPWNLAVVTGLREELSIVRMKWSSGEGFADPKWESIPSVPPYLAALVKSCPRDVQGSANRLLCSVGRSAA